MASKDQQAAQRMIADRREKAAWLTQLQEAVPFSPWPTGDDGK